MTDQRSELNEGRASSGVEGPETPEPALISRRRAISRVSKGAIAAGVVAWVTPEILIATPDPAAAMSAPPGGGNNGGGGSTGGGGGTGGGGNLGGGGRNGGAATSPSGSGTLPATSAATGSSNPSVGTGTGTGGSLPFTGLDAVRDAGIAAGLITGGWALKRWASRPGPAATSDPGTGAGTSPN